MYFLRGIGNWQLAIGKSTKGRCVGCVRSGKPVQIEIINIWRTLQVDLTEILHYQ